MDSTGFAGALVARSRIDGVPKYAISRIGYSDDSTGASTRVDTNPKFDWGTVKGRSYSFAAMVHSDSKIGNIGSMISIAVR